MLNLDIVKLIYNLGHIPQSKLPANQNSSKIIMIVVEYLLNIAKRPEEINDSQSWKKLLVSRKESIRNLLVLSLLNRNLIAPLPQLQRVIAPGSLFISPEDLLNTTRKTLVRIRRQQQQTTALVKFTNWLFKQCYTSAIIDEKFANKDLALKQLRTIMKYPQHINPNNQFGIMPMTIAVWTRNMEAVKILHAAGSVFDTQSRVGITILMKGATCDKRFFDYMTEKNEEAILENAASIGNLTAVKVCIYNGEAETGRALKIAVRKKHTQIVKFLIQHGAPIERPLPDTSLEIKLIIAFAHKRRTERMEKHPFRIGYNSEEI